MKSTLNPNDFDNHLMDGLLFCKRVNDRFEQIRNGANGKERLRLRKDRADKKLIEELIPIARDLQSRYRLGWRLKVRWLAGNQKYDAALNAYGAFLDHALIPKRMFIEVTSLVHENDHLLRRALNERIPTFHRFGDVTRTLEKKRITRVVVVCIVAILLAVFFFYDIHLATEGTDNSYLMWNSEEAYLFARWNRGGYHFTAFEYLLEYIPAYFGVNLPVADQRSSTVVLRITPTKVERYVIERYMDDQGFWLYVPHGQKIYAYGGGDIYRWDDTHFDKANPQEQQEFALTGSNLLSKQDFYNVFTQDFANVEGWSRKKEINLWPPKFEIEIGGQALAFLTTASQSNQDMWLELQRHGQPPRRLLQRRTLHFVSRSQYRGLFKKLWGYAEH